jgi:hypothetical protein
VTAVTSILLAASSAVRLAFFVSFLVSTHFTGASLVEVALLLVVGHAASVRYMFPTLLNVRVAHTLQGLDDLGPGGRDKVALSRAVGNRETWKAENRRSVQRWNAEAAIYLSEKALTFVGWMVVASQLELRAFKGSKVPNLG